MKIATVKITGISPYSQSKPHREEKKNKESPDAYEERTWKARMHVNSEGQLFMPAMAIKNCLAEAAKFLGMQVPGRGKATYTKHFESGVLVFENAVIHGRNNKPILAEDCDKKDANGKLISQLFGDWIFTPSDGVPGSGKRVYKCYPVIIDPWYCILDIYIMDDTITQDVLKKHLITAGSLIGLGRFRVRNRGTYGRFSSEILNWVEQDDVEVA